MGKPRIMSRREYFWRQLLPGAPDEESRRIMLGYIAEEVEKNPLEPQSICPKFRQGRTP